MTSFSGRSIFRNGALLVLLGTAGASQACSASDPAHPGAGGGQNAQGGATNASGGQSGGSTANGGAPSGGAPQGGAPQGGAPQGGASNGGTTNASGGNPQGGNPQGGSQQGGSPANGGSASGGTAGSAGSAQGGSSTAGTSSGSPDCPATATWCSSFEEDKLPTGAVYKLNGDPATPWTHDFQVDSSVSKVGRSSLLVKSAADASGAYKMLAVPSGAAAFWVRFYVRSNVDLGASDHNVYAQAAGSDDPNDANNVEFAEDVGLAFNSHDAVRWPEGYGRTSGGGTKPYTLPKDMWHCIEVFFDGPGKHQQLFINGMQQIDATAFPTTAYTFKNFRFGYNSLHGTNRKLWYDAVAVGPSRMNCQ